MAGEIFLPGMDERRVPAPAVGAGDPHAALEQVQGCLAPHAAALGDIIRASIGGASTGVHQHDLQRRELVPNALELGFDLAGAGDVAVGKMAEVELDPRLEAPLEWNLVDGDRALAAL